MLKRRIEKLESLGLIRIIKNKINSNKQKYSYRIIRKESSKNNEMNFSTFTNNMIRNEKENENKNENNLSKTIATTSFNDILYLPNNKTKYIYNIYIKDLNMAREIANDLFKKLNIKKEIVKANVLKRLEMVYKKINLNSAQNYIIKVINDVVVYFDVLSKKYYSKINIDKKFSVKRSVNFTQRNISKSEFEQMYDNPSSLGIE